jgi:acyl-CoA synthetase (AMP-forming)/AMP-acid ligase II
MDLPSLRVMVVGGELISEKELKLWQENADLYFSYGPSECSVFCATTGKISATASGRNMGLTFGCRSWIVDQHNHQKLSPIGAIGELLIEGPLVARSCKQNPPKQDGLGVTSLNMCFDTCFTVKVGIQDTNMSRGVIY